MTHSNYGGGALTPVSQHSSFSARNVVVTDVTMQKMQALQDLEANMDRLHKVIVQKDIVIDGLKRQLDMALNRLESGETLPSDEQAADAERSSRLEQRLAAMK